MCGRYTLAVDIEELTEHFACTADNQEIKPRYNVAPSQYMPVVAEISSKRQICMMQWGLVPFWAKDFKIGNKLINARIESIDEKTSFKYALRERRCIIPADGYYEWQQTDTGKQAMHIIMPDKRLFGMAGLWEKRPLPDGSSLIFTYTIVTTPAIPSLAHIHARMPLVLNREQECLWLQGALNEETGHFLQKFQPVQELVYYPVSSQINNPRNDDLSCIRPVA